MNESTCIDCGSAPVNHGSEWWSNWLEHWSNRYAYPLEYTRQLVQPAISFLPWNWLALLLLRTASYLRIIEISDQLLDTDSSRTKALWDSAQTRNIVVQRIKVFGRPSEISIARHRKHSQVFMSMPRPAGPPSHAYFWMDNKSVMHKRFIDAGIPVPKSFECRTLSQALQAFKQINSSVIVKPTYGSRSRHTIVGINTEQELEKAFGIAQQISPWVMVQEELSGMVHRILWVGNKVVAVMRREPAYVTGNGASSIKELVDLENKNPLRQGPIFHHLPTDAEASEELQRNGLAWDTVLPAGSAAILNPKVSRGNGAVNVDVTEQTHPENMKLFQKIGLFVNDPLVGVDFIIQDITRPWQEQIPCGVIECNALPYVDLHSYPYAGPVRDAAGALWEIVFPKAALPQQEAQKFG
jgi:D-alanine-D-alanine ligase-like ATP-grasp enzyme